VGVEAEAAEGGAGTQAALDGIPWEAEADSAAPGMDSSAAEPAALERGERTSHLGFAVLEVIHGVGLDYIA
jgi:hypothetical protein